MTFDMIGQALFVLQLLQFMFMLAALPTVATRGGLGFWVLLSMLIIGLSSVLWIGRQVWA